jgi:hypothetical protein
MTKEALGPSSVVCPLSSVAASGAVLYGTGNRNQASDSAIPRELMSRAITSALGTTSFKISNRFVASVAVSTLTPVMLLPGRLRFTTKPCWTG